MGNIEDRVLGIISRQLGVEKDRLTRDKAFIKDLAADTLDHVKLIMAIEDEFGMCILDDDVEQINTVGELVDYVNSEVEPR